MKKIISFSLWGDNPLYVKGAYENIKLQRQFYKDWICRFYIHDSVPEDTKQLLIDEGAEVVEKHEDLKKYAFNIGWFWRFEVLDDTDVQRFIVRDIDSRISQRELNCVIDWQKSKLPFHIIRDHRMHGVRLIAGMWGATKDFSDTIDYEKLRDEFFKHNPENNPVHGGYDQFFLSTVIYPLVKKNSCIHDDYHFFKDEIVRHIPHLKSKDDFIGKPVEV